jgi:hypothetical protein
VSDLHEDLNTALAAVEPGAAPVEAAMRAGKRIRNWRRAGVLAGAVAVVAAAVVGVPVLGHQLALPSPPASSVRETVVPPGPHAPAGTIASGLIGTKPWSARIEYPGTAKCLATGTNLVTYNCKGALPTADGDPISIANTGIPNSAYQIGTFTYLICFGLVQPDVASARVVLADGKVLTLQPVTVGGSRWVAFPSSEGLLIDTIIAYSRTGEIATAIVQSYSPSGLAKFVAGVPVFGPWRQPG